MEYSLPRAPLILRVATFTAFALSLSACTYDSADLRDYVAEVKSRPGGPLGEIPRFPRPKPIPPISHKTDPFESFLADELDNTTKPVPPENLPWPPRNREELERFSLDSLRMVGSLEQQDEQWGLVKDPGRVIHRVFGRSPPTASRRRRARLSHRLHASAQWTGLFGWDQHMVIHCIHSFTSTCAAALSLDGYDSVVSRS